MNCTIHSLVHAHSASQGTKIKSKDLSEAGVLRERGINRNGIILHLSIVQPIDFISIADSMSFKFLFLFSP